MISAQDYAIIFCYLYIGLIFPIGRFDFQLGKPTRYIPRQEEEESEPKKYLKEKRLNKGKSKEERLMILNQETRMLVPLIRNGRECSLR